MTSPIAPPSSDAVAMIIATALDEDRSTYDITPRSTVLPDQPGGGTVLYKQGGVVCGLDVLAQVFQQVSDEIEVTSEYQDGDIVEAGTAVAEVIGPLAAILSGERVALNLIQRMSGIATMSRQYSEAAARGGAARVVDTRKTTPGLRAIERYAVRVGGSHNHRNTLEDGILIKDNHIEAAAQRDVDLAGVIALARDGSSHMVRIEVEVTDAAMAREAIVAGADVVMLDNMTVDEMRAVVDEHRADPSKAHVLFEASGGITIATIADVAATGVDLISCGALTHSAPALDISLDVRPA
ncbi:MAG: carboxylating nicotinate-nucleotide diphosphorylase [Chloroflexi bacterium]|nr:carboxylating nicotinate-nucleotide diphosphorylase [Chloroflexota bacterium]